MIQCWEINEPAQMEQVAREIILLSKSKIILLNGAMGAGKTTFVGYFLTALGSSDPVQSPSFALVNEYIAGNEPIYHFDFYRIVNFKEALQIGAEEYFESGNYCFIEWSEKIKEILPSDVSTVSIEIAGANSRKIILNFN